MGCSTNRYRLGDLCEFYRGASVPRTRMHGSGDYLYLHYGDLYRGFSYRIDVEHPQKPIPYILNTEKIKNEQRLFNQDIVYVLTSETVEDLGHSFLFNNPQYLPAVAGTETTIVRVKDHCVLLPAYLNYLMHSPQFLKILRQYVRGMKVFRVHPRDVARIEIELPDIETQKKAVFMLDAIHEKLLLNSRTNGYLEELLDAEFAEMQAEADDTWKDVSLLDIANYKNGLAMQKFRPQPGDKGLPVLKIRELGQGECGPDAERCSSDIEDSVHVRDGDLIFSWSGTLMLDFWAGGDAGLNQHLFKMTSDKYPSWFYYMWTKHHMRKFIAMAKDRATTMGHIKRSALANAAVRIPPSDVLLSQTKAMQPLVDEVVGLKIQSRKLANLRDALLPKLMSGEIDVSKVDLTQPNSHLSGC